MRLVAIGPEDSGTNPEQWFAAGWSAWFEGAMGIAARKMRIPLPPRTAVDTKVDLCQAGNAFFLKARFNVSLPGLEHGVAQKRVEAAHQTCPYSEASNGNIEVVTHVVGLKAILGGT